MTSPRLWLLLSVLAVPLFLWTSTGCDLVFQLERLGGSNAYTCACSCNPGPRDRTNPVGARADDAVERRSDGAITLGDNDLPMTGASLIGVRFATLGIPPGANILSAYVQFTAAQNDPAGASIDIRIEASDDAPAFTNTNFNLSSRPTDALTVTWSALAWSANDAGPAERTDDLATLIQAVVSLPGWTDASSLVLLLGATSGGRSADSFDRSATRAPTLHVTYYDPNANVTANLPVCLPEESNPNLNENAPSPEANDNAVLVNDCENRVENTYKGLVGTCGYNPDPSTNCNCEVVPTNYHDNNSNGMQDSGEEYFGFVREICDHQPSPVCAEHVLAADCSNFDPQQLAACVAERVAFCDAHGVSRVDCDTDDCLAFVNATNAAGDDPVCIAHASAGPQPLAFQMFGRRSTCEVVGLSEIQVGDDGREPKKDPLTRGTLELLGGPCPGEPCSVGVSMQLGMNPITFSVKWASDPTFSDLIQAGNTVLDAASLDGSGVGALPADSTVGVGRGRRSSTRKAVLGTNASPVDLAVDWAGFACSLNGNLASTVDAEDPEGVCAGDGATFCRVDSPDCDSAGGGPCQLPDGDQEPFVVNVALDGTLINQPPTAKAGDDQAVECTSTGGADFVLDGSQSFDPDGDIRIVSWRAGSRVGPETSFDLITSAALGLGESQTYVLRVIDAHAQADEDPVTVQVVDTTPPQISAEWVPLIPQHPRDEEFRIEFSATDVCDAEPVTIGVLETPSVDGLRIRQLKTRTPPRVRFDLRHKKLRIQGTDPAATLKELMTLGGLRVFSGLRTEVEVLAPHKGVWKFEFKKDGHLEIEAVSVVLRVTSRDATGNTATVEVSP